MVLGRKKARWSRYSAFGRPPPGLPDRIVSALRSRDEAVDRNRTHGSAPTHRRPARKKQLQAAAFPKLAESTI